MYDSKETGMRNTGVHSIVYSLRPAAVPRSIHRIDQRQFRLRRNRQAFGLSPCGSPPSEREALGAHIRHTASRFGPLPEGAVSEADWGSWRELAGQGDNPRGIVGRLEADCRHHAPVERDAAPKARLREFLKRKNAPEGVPRITPRHVLSYVITRPTRTPRRRPRPRRRRSSARPPAGPRCRRS